VSIIRLIIIHQFEQVDITWTYVDAGIWTSVEPTIGVCSACLPILRALWVWRRPQSSVQRSAQKSPRTVAEPKPAQPVDRPRAEHVRGSSSASRYPLNELSSESMMGWGKHVSLSSSGHERGSPSDASDIAMDDLAGRAEEPQPAKKKKKHKRDPSSILRIKPIAELYG
jgi:nitric oxide reductase activation protein